MNTELFDFLSVYKCGLWRITDSPSFEITNRIVQLAINQGIFPVFYAGVNALKNIGKITISDELYKQIKNTALTVVGKNIRKQQMALVLFSELEKQGINFCILKGETLAVLYPESSFRISGDIDMLIDKTDLVKTSQILESFGFKVNPLMPASQHLVAKHPVIGTVEAHITLFDEHLTEPFFKKHAELHENYIKVGNTKINTLGINDGLVFIFFHLVKHLLIEGVGIRQFTDLLIYIKFYKNQIDWEAFKAIINDLKYDTIFDVILTIGTKYLGFSCDELPEFSMHENLALNLLEDVLAGGCFGFSDEKRNNFSNTIIYEKQKANNTPKTELKIWNKKRFLFLVFPPASHLKNKFKYVKKKPFLYPVAWLHRLLYVLLFAPQKIVNMVLKNTLISKMDLNNKKRLQLIKDLKMI